MAGIVFMRSLSRSLLLTCSAKATRFRGSNRCYRTTFGQTATLLTVNNNWFCLVSDLNIIIIVFSTANMEECGAFVVVSAGSLMSSFKNDPQPGFAVNFCLNSHTVFSSITVCRIKVLRSSWGFLHSPVWVMAFIKDYRDKLWFWL